MQLSRVHIRNFRNFANLKIDPFPNPAVIVGEKNGVGKSNLLFALRLVLDPDFPDRRRWLQPDDIHDGGPPMTDDAEVSVQFELTDFDEGDDARSELDGAIVDTDPLVARLTYLFKPKTSLAAVLGTAARPPLTPDDYQWTIYGADDPSNAMLAAKRYAALSVLPPLRDARETSTDPSAARSPGCFESCPHRTRISAMRCARCRRPATNWAGIRTYEKKFEA